MYITVTEAANLGFEAKHHSSSPEFGNGQGPQILKKAARTVLEFLREDVPKDLKLAASSLWLAVEHAELGTLYGAIHNRASRRPYVYSEDAWRLLFIRDSLGVGLQAPESVGLAFTRTVETADALSDSLPPPNPTMVPGYHRGLGRGPTCKRHAEAYVWVQPESRQQGVATAAIDRLDFYKPPEGFQMPFEIDPTNVAAAKLIERYAHEPEAALV